MSRGQWIKWIAISAIILAVLLFGTGWAVRWQQRADIAEGSKTAPLPVESASFADGGSMPQRLGCDGADLSPELHWPAPPAGSKSLAIVMDDPDAPLGFIHWIVYNIPAGTRDIAEGASAQGKLPRGALEGFNGFGNAAYGGPCPPGTEPHHYVVRLYALDAKLDLAPGASKQELAAAVEGHVLAQGHITGLYGRNGR